MKRSGANRFRVVSVLPGRRAGWPAAVRVAVSLALFLGAIFPSWHRARANETAFRDLAELQLLLGEKLDDLRSSLCSHGDGNSPALPGDDESKLCNHCPLCLAFQHLAALSPPRDLGRLARRSFTPAFFPLYRSRLAAFRKLDRARPREPPLA